METVQTSLSRTATDPIRNFKFLVTITHPTSGKNLATLGFMSVSGLNVQTESIAYRQGNYNTSPQYMPGQSQFSPITLQRGILLGTRQNWDWMKEIFTVLAGTGPTTPGADFRGTLDIKVLDHPVTHGTKIPVKLWYRLFRAWPQSWASSDLDAGGNGFMVESITVVHEGFDIGWATAAAGSDAPQPAVA